MKLFDQFPDAAASLEAVDAAAAATPGLLVL